MTVKTNPSGQSCTVSSGSGTVGSANVTNVAVSCGASSTATSASNFNRADGPLGANWTDISDGGMAISSGAVIGTAGRVTGDVWERWRRLPCDPVLPGQVTSAQLTGGQWVGPAVRAQNSGQNGYVGFYYWNNGSPELMLYKRTARAAGPSSAAVYSSGPLAAGTQLEVMAVGRTISFLVNGVRRFRSLIPASPAGRRGSWPTAAARPVAGPAARPRRGLLDWRDCVGAFRDGGAAG